MWLSRLEIEAIRNIKHAALCPAPGYNLITGSNGSGKSSLLEAIQCLSTGKSFRTHRKLPLITQGAERAIVHGQITSPTGVARAGIMKRIDGSTVVRLDGHNLESQAELALRLPILGISPESDDIIGEGSKARQAFLDWTLFHVEQNFRECWRNYRRVLLQRNSALRDRQSLSTVLSWDSALAVHGEQVTEWRMAAFKRISDRLSALLSRLLPDSDIHFTYRQGWPKEQTLAEALSGSLDTDRKLGFTHYGPHRADIMMKGPLGALGNSLSRGQRKLAAICMKIAQASDYISISSKSPILYIDDLASELDPSNRDHLLRELLSLNIQLFITAIAERDMPMLEYPPQELFHVEQGCVSNVV